MFTSLEMLPPVVPPGVEFRLIGINRSSLVVSVPVYGQRFVLFPALHAADATPQVGSDLLPGIQALTGGVFRGRCVTGGVTHGRTRVKDLFASGLRDVTIVIGLFLRFQQTYCHRVKTRHGPTALDDACVSLGVGLRSESEEVRGFPVDRR